MPMCNGRAALERLLKGNKRFAVDSLQHPNQTAARRMELSSGQSPFAVILTCSDSRVPPEIIFDQGLGDLFVVRVAGNIVDAVVLESIEYAVAHLHTPLIVVLGHTDCGAIKAALQSDARDENVSLIVEAILPAIAAVGDCATADRGDMVARENVRLTVETLKTSRPILSPQVHEGALLVVGAFYDLKEGTVEILEPPLSA